MSQVHAFEGVRNVLRVGEKLLGEDQSRGSEGRDGVGGYEAGECVHEGWGGHLGDFEAGTWDSCEIDYSREGGWRQMSADVGSNGS